MRFFLWGIGLFALLAATVGIAQPAIEAGQEKIEKFGFVLASSKWPTTAIGVCWEDMGDSTKADRQLVRQAIAATWERHSKIKFSGWESICEPSSPGIHIAVRDSVSETQALGSYLDQMPRGMILNFTMDRWKPPCRGSRDDCIAAIATHEFGHALGFSHEQNRPDAPDLCREKKQGAEGDYFLTVYDKSSIMNYCNANWTGQGQLSELDKEAAAKFYGAV